MIRIILYSIGIVFMICLILYMVTHPQKQVKENKMSMSCLDCHDYMDGFNRGKKEGTIEELEKLKAEFEEDKYILLNQTTAIKVIDKYISEIKGDKE